MVILDRFKLNYFPIESGKIYYGDRTFVFLNNKNFHKYYGPTQIFKNGAAVWWFNGKRYGRSDDGYNQQKFLKDVGKQWLL